MQITVAEVRDALRTDVLSLALGALLVIVGALTSGLSTIARGRKGPTLSLGVFAFLYGFRLLARTDVFRVGIGQTDAFWEHLAAALTYVLPIPLLLFARALEPSWKRVWNPVLAGMLVFAAYAIAADWIAGVPNTARILNNTIAIGLIVALLAIFFRPGLPATHELRSWRLGIASVSLGALADNLRGMDIITFPGPDLEPFGFTFAIGCFGLVLGRRVLGDARRLASLDRELGIARDIQSSILPQAMPRVAGLDVAAVYRPMTAVAGDFYDFLETGDGRLGVLVADVSGHGVPAALIASMVKVALAAQQAHADDPGDVLTGINRALYGRLGRQYVTAAYLFVDVAAGVMRYAAAGHPPMLRSRQRGARVDAIAENGLLLGFLEDAAYTAREEPLVPGDRLLLYTDGLFEAENLTDEPYGLERVMNSLGASAGTPAPVAAEAIVKAMNDWSNRPALDDLTLVLLDRGQTMV